MPARKRKTRADPPKVFVPRVPYRDALERVYQRAFRLRTTFNELDDAGELDAELTDDPRREIEAIIALCAWHITPERRLELERRKPDATD